MKTTIVFISLLLIVFGCNNQKSKNNSLSKMNLNGKVKAVKSVSYIAIVDENNVHEKGERRNRERIHHTSLNRLMKFDELGNRLSAVHSNSNGINQFSAEFIYNAYGYNDEINFFDSEANPSDKVIILFDKSQRPIKELWYSKYGGLGRKKTISYDNYGNKVEEKIFEMNKLHSIWRYEYDKNNQVIEERIYDNDDSLLNKYNYVLDENGNEIELIKHDGDGNLVFHLKYELEFDDKNNWIRRIEYNENVAELIIERDITYY